MKLSVNDMWEELKSDIEGNLKNLIQDKNKDDELSDVFALMLSMLNTTKIKQSYNNKEVNHDRKTKLET